jgi:WD40 repeat protein
MNFHEHKREAYAVAWSPVTKDTFASSSWDGTVKIVWPLSFLWLPLSRLAIVLTSCFTVVSGQDRVSQDPPCRQLHLQHVILSLQSQYNLSRIDRLAPPHLRSSNACQRPIPPYHQDTSPSASVGADAPGCFASVHAGRDINSRLEQV